jgi:hypothetical protein
VNSDSSPFAFGFLFAGRVEIRRELLLHTRVEIEGGRAHRIHELLDGSGADVTWKDRVPDPDNPKQQRQIDVTVGEVTTSLS